MIPVSIGMYAKDRSSLSNQLRHPGAIMPILKSQWKHVERVVERE